MGTNHYIPKGAKPEFNKILDHLLHLRKTNPDISINHPTVLQYYKNFQVLSRLRGTALCLLKTQYARKKRNPE